MKSYNYILYFFVLIILSCSRSSDNKIAGFPEEKNLVSEQKLIEGVEMRYPFRIRLDDSFMYIMDLHATTNYCHQFKYPSMEYVTSFGKRGESPDELLDSENIRIDKYSNCYILDANKNQIVCFNQNNQRVIKLNEHLIRSLDFAFYNDTAFVVPDYSGTCRYHLIDNHGNIMRSGGKIPLKERNENIPELAYAQAWRPFLDYNQNNDVLAIATQLGEVIELYSLKKDSLIRVIKGEQGDPIFKYAEGYAIPNGIMGYSDIFVGEKYIYALFLGHTFDDLKQEIVKVEGGNQIQVFDLSGNPVRCYKLERYISGFCIDEKRGIMLGLDVNSDLPLIEYRISL